MHDALESDGFAFVPQALTPAERTALCDALETVDGPGRRGLLSVPAAYASLGACCALLILGLMIDGR